MDRTIQWAVSMNIPSCIRRVELHTSLWARSLIRLLSRLGSCMTSPFRRRSAASPDTGLLLAVVEGLSFALTQGARPWSGISLVTFPYMAAMSWLWRCSLEPSGEVIKGSMRSLNSAWLRRPEMRVREQLIY